MNIEWFFKAVHTMPGRSSCLSRTLRRVMLEATGREIRRLGTMLAHVDSEYELPS